jgi:RND family efflux transporter MFP subunit
LLDPTEVEAVAQVFEAQIAGVKPGQAVSFTALAYPNSTFPGRVKDIAPSVNRDTGTVRVFVQVPNPDGRLLLGMRGQLAFVVAESDTAVVVPRTAILGEAGDFFVFRQVMTGPFQYERAAVEVGLRNDRFVEIIDGVLPGDRVVTRGSYQLQFVGAGAAKIEDDHSHGPGGHQH